MSSALVPPILRDLLNLGNLVGIYKRKILGNKKERKHVLNQEKSKILEKKKTRFQPRKKREKTRS